MTTCCSIDVENGDLLFVRARLLDELGFSCFVNVVTVSFQLEGDGEFANASGVSKIENGVATALVRVRIGARFLKLAAEREGLPISSMILLEKQNI